MPSPILDTLLKPRSVAMVGATPKEKAAANRVLRNLKSRGFTGAIYPVNPRYDEVLGHKCYPSLADLPEVPDAVFIALAAEHVEGALAEAAALGVKNVLTNAAGFADKGEEGKRRQDRLTEIARANGMTLCGPNNMGFVNIHDRVCLWTPRRLPPLDAGPIALISQSGSMTLIMAEHERRLGFAYIITAGNEAVCTAGDYLGAVVRDDRVKVVAMFLEAIRDPEAFAAAAREAAKRGKPIVVLKVGRTSRSQAVISGHTGAVAGDDQIYDAFFRHHGIIRVNDVDELIETTVLLAEHASAPEPRGIVAISCSGGEAGLIADLGAPAGIVFSDYAQPTIAVLQEQLGLKDQPRNPLDVWGLGWSNERFGIMLDALLADPAVGAIACSIDAPFDGGVDVAGSCEMATVCVAKAAATDKKFVFFNNTAARLHPEVAAILEPAGIPYLAGMRASLGAIGHWTRKHAPATDVSIPRAASGFPDPAKMSDAAKFALLASAGVPMADCVEVTSREAAIAAAERLGDKVALKATAPDLPHKTELGFVRLGISGHEDVARTYEELAAGLARHSSAGNLARVVIQPMTESGVELLLGIRNDNPLGSAVVVGLGGTYVEIASDVAVRIGPVDLETAHAMLAETKAAKLLAGVRGKGPFDADAAAQAIVALSAFGARTRGTYAGIEVNPLIVLPAGHGAVGVDAVIEKAAPGHDE